MSNPSPKSTFVSLTNTTTGYVGYEPVRKAVVVARQGTDFGKRTWTRFETMDTLLIPFFAVSAIITDAKVGLRALDKKLFPGVSSSVKVHAGFADAQARCVHIQPTKHEIP